MAAAAVNSIAASQRFLPLSRHTINTTIIAAVKDSKTHLPNLRTSSLYLPPINRCRGRQTSVVCVATEDVIPLHSNDPVDQQQDVASAAGTAQSDEDSAAASAGNTTATHNIQVQVAAFAFESEGGGGGRGRGGAFPSSSSSSQTLIDQLEGGEDFNKMADRAINAAIVLAAGTFAITKLLTIDRDYWHEGEISNLR